MLIGLLLLAAGPAGDGCVRTVRAIAAGSSPALGDFAPAPSCPGVRRASFRYDADVRAAVAIRDIPAGELLPSIAPSLHISARPGQGLRLRERIGAVTVERDVTAVQAGRAGQRLFVTTADGAVFSAELAQ